jgi:hypothetical protein
VAEFDTTPSSHHHHTFADHHHFFSTSLQHHIIAVAAASLNYLCAGLGSKIPETLAATDGDTLAFLAR